MTPRHVRYCGRPLGLRLCWEPWPVAIDVTIPGETYTSTRDAQVPPHGLCWDARMRMADEKRAPGLLGLTRGNDVPGRACAGGCSPNASVSSSMETSCAEAPWAPRVILRFSSATIWLASKCCRALPPTFATRKRLLLPGANMPPGPGS